MLRMMVHSQNTASTHVFLDRRCSACKRAAAVPSRVAAAESSAHSWAGTFPLLGTTLWRAQRTGPGYPRNSPGQRLTLGVESCIVLGSHTTLSLAICENKAHGIVSWYHWSSQ